ncbi:MAG: hypothetical protein ACKO0W_06985 [Planctomycetota bacterium]
MFAGIRATVGLLAAREGLSLGAAARAVGRDPRSIARMREMPGLDFADDLARALRWPTPCLARVLADLDGVDDAGDDRLGFGSAVADADLDDDRVALARLADAAFARAETPAALGFAVLLRVRAQVAIGAHDAARELIPALRQLPEPGVEADGLRTAIAIDLAIDARPGAHAWPFLADAVATLESIDEPVDRAAAVRRASGLAAIRAIRGAQAKRSDRRTLEPLEESLDGLRESAAANPRCRAAHRALAWGACAVGHASRAVREASERGSVGHRMATRILVCAGLALDDAREREELDAGLGCAAARRSARLALAERVGRARSAENHALSRDSDAIAVRAHLPCAAGLHAEPKGRPVDNCRKSAASSLDQRSDSFQRSRVAAPRWMDPRHRSEETC